MFRRWYIWLPLFLIGLETLCQGLYPFSSPYFPLLFAKQPVSLTLQAGLGIVRAFLGYAFVCVVTDLLFQAVLKQPALRCGTFVIFYLGVCRWILKDKPAIANLFQWNASWLLLVFGFLTFFFATQKARTSPTRLGFLAVLFAAVLFATKNPVWIKTSLPEHRDKIGTKPSFYLMSFDAVPGDVFRYSDGTKVVAPLWKKKWGTLAAQYVNAYSLSNSTFTSWFSLLSGEYPLLSNVLSLYPHAREGTIPVNRLLPAQLRARGYRTVFLTDCANTSYMKPEYGFDSIYHVDRGGFGATRSLVTSAHPLLYVFDFLIPNRYLLPELDAFSSTLYRPENFFRQIKTLFEELDSGENPYFLVFHSCLTHRDIAKHTPPSESPFVRDLPLFQSTHSSEMDEMMKSIRLADYHLNDLLEQSENSRHKLWRFVLSDHGVRINQYRGKFRYFSHVLGDCVNRFQYNIPLAFFPPEQSVGSLSEMPVSLLDMHATLVELAGLNVPSRGQSLLSKKKKIPILLSSALPTGTPEDWGKSLIPFVRDGTLTDSGEFSFTPEQEHQFNQNRSYALLDWPYRLVSSGRNSWFLYDEEHDPYNQTDLQETKRMVFRRLRAEFDERITPFLSKQGALPQPIETFH